jgi:hypothetical protein
MISNDCGTCARTRLACCNRAALAVALAVLCLGSVAASAAEASDPLWWDVPTSGQQVAGVLNESNGNCRVGVAGGIVVDHIDFYIDGRYLNTERYDPYSCIVDTRTLTAGTHTLTSVGFDTAGRSARVSTDVWVGGSTSTAAPPPPPPPPASTAPDVSCDRVASPSGSDSGLGTLSSPYRTVARLRDSLSAGQTGCLREGTYGSSTSWTDFNRSGANGNPITFVSYPGERATLVGGYSVTGDYVTLSHLTINETYLRPRTYHYGCDSQGALALDIYSSYVTLEYNDIGQSSISPAQRDTAIGVWANSSGSRTTNVVIRNNKIHDFGSCSAFDHGVYFDHTANGDIYSNWIYNPPCSYGEGGGDHSRGCGSGIQLYIDPIGTQVHGNVIDGTGTGLFMSGSGGKVYNNVITNTRGYYQSGALRPPSAFSGYGGYSNLFVDNMMFNVDSVCADCSGVASLSGDVVADPQYVDRANGNYALRSTSTVPSSWGLWNGTG